MARRKRIQVIFTISKSVVKFISDATAFKEALMRPAAMAHVSIPAADITALGNQLSILLQQQAIVAKRKKGTAGNRDIAWLNAIKSVRQLVAIVQHAMDKAPDAPAAVAIAQSCGLRVRKPRVVSKPDFEVRRNKEVPGLLHFISKAKHKRDNARYIWHVSTNGRTFIQVKVTHTCLTTWQSDVAPGTKLFFRKGIISRRTGDEPEWSQIVTLIVT